MQEFTWLQPSVDQAFLLLYVTLRLGRLQKLAPPPCWAFQLHRNRFYCKCFPAATQVLENKASVHWQQRYVCRQGFITTS